MIPVTRLDGARIVLNDDLIESIQQTPDTVVSLVNGHKLLLRDTPDDIVDRVIAFKQAVHRSGGIDVCPDAAPRPVNLELSLPTRT